jgi:NTE family protein
MSVIRGRFRRSGPGTVFVLGGGGNLGAIQVGMLRALIERGIVPDAVVGCSVGALNAAAVAGSPTVAEMDRLASLWRGLRGTDIFPPRKLSGPWQIVTKGAAIYPNYGLRSVIERWMPYRTFEETAVPLHVVATSLRTERAHWFTSGDIVRALLASTSLPAIFPPVDIDGEPMIDGGVVNNVPVSRAIALKARRIYVMHVGHFDRVRPAPQRPVDVLIHAFSIARGYRFREDLDDVPEGTEMITLPGIDPGPLKYNDFRRSAELIERGHSVAGAFLDARARERGA